MLKLNASYSKKVPAEEEYSSQSFHASVEVGLPDGLTQDQLQVRWKRNCTEMSLAIMRGIPPQKSAKPRRRATGQQGVRTTFRRVRNSSRICSISPGSAESLRSRSPRNMVCRTCGSSANGSVRNSSTAGGRHDGNHR